MTTVGLCLPQLGGHVTRDALRACVESAVAVARRLRTGQVSVNGGRFNVLAPFGGFKKSGVGRELGPHGLAEYFELVSLQLPADAPWTTTVPTAP